MGALAASAKTAKPAKAKAAKAAKAADPEKTAARTAARGQRRIFRQDRMK
jgi:hypothetical protein